MHSYIGYPIFVGNFDGGKASQKAAIGDNFFCEVCERNMEEVTSFVVVFKKVLKSFWVSIHISKVFIEITLLDSY